MSNSLPSLYQQYIHLSRYSRWLHDENRRETWDETVTRYFNFFEKHLQEKLGYKVSKNERKELEEAVFNLEIMPSMRCLMTAGPALERDNAAAFNCSYLAINRMQAFDEVLYLLMNGCGVGFSVERQNVTKLPEVAEDFHVTDTTIVVPDSKIGWAKSLRELIGLLYQGQIPAWDLSKLRPAGAPLKTFGGRSSGPDPLDETFRFVVNMFHQAAGRKLTSLECHDLVCKIADCVIVGGVRRSALISLSNLSDDRMRHAKSGQWWETQPQRRLSNNSAAYTEKPDVGIFMDEWKSLYDSKSGERGIFNREGAQKHIENFGRRDPSYDFGLNPCAEILLRDRGFCNLSEVVIRDTDDSESLKRKIRLATILGTWQSTLTDYRYLSKKWKENAEEERLLGVSLTGIMDNEITNGKKGKEELSKLLEELRLVSVETNKDYSKKLKISQSVAVTSVKPSGTVSQLVDSASGIHARHNEYYIRTVRADKRDPLAEFMVQNNFPHEEDLFNKSDWVFSFPMKAPHDAVFRMDMSALEQLELWKIYYENYTEHNPSVTISVKEHEWMDVGAWVYKNFDEMCGISFLPFSEHIYKQAPYQDISAEQYQELVERMPSNIDWSLLSEFEKNDNTNGSQELACVAGGCEI